MTSLEQKLQTVFSESYQVKRMEKCTYMFQLEVQNLRAMKQKKQIELKIAIINNYAVIFNIQFNGPLLKKNTSVKEYYSRAEFTIVILKQYPAVPPKVFFYGETVELFFFKAFRNYFNTIVQEWNPKCSLADITRKVSEYIYNDKEKNHQKDQLPFQQNLYFSIDKILSCKFLQNFPVKIFKNRKDIGSLLIIYSNQLLLFQQTALQSYFRSVDCILLKHIIGLSRNRTRPNKLLIQVKRKGKIYGVQLISQESQQILQILTDQIRSVLDKGSSKLNSNEEKDSESESDEQKVEFFLDDKKEIGTIQQIRQSICIYQSLVDNQMTSENVSNLVILLKKAIQYYSANNDDKFKIYLKKLQDLMTNQMAQVLISSKNEKKQNQNKQQYVSIIDM